MSLKVKSNLCWKKFKTYFVNYFSVKLKAIKSEEVIDILSNY